MQTCKGCREQQTNDQLCLSCIEDLNSWLRTIPDLYAELGSVRLPGSVRSPGPRSYRTALTASASPVRLEVVDLLDRGETLKRLLKWTDTGYDVAAICEGFRQHLLSIAGESWAPEFWRDMRSLCRDLGRVVGEPEDRPVGKCSRPYGDEICRGQLFRTGDGAGVFCRRCGDRPELLAAEVWVSLEQAARLTGRPLETVRTWYKRGRLSWDGIGPQPFRMAWLPTAVRLADGSVTTLPPRRVTVNHESAAELSPLDRNQAATTAATRQVNPDNDERSGSDADVLGRLVTGNVTPPDGAPSGTAVAPDSAVARPAPHVLDATGTDR